MIDQNLISIATDQAKVSIANCYPTLSPDLFLIDNVIDYTMINKLKSYLTENQIEWQNCKSMHRNLLCWKNDTVIEELHEMCNNLTDVISEQFFNSKLNFIGIQIWKDTADFTMSWHSDNSIINVALQVYMFDAPLSCGTTFITKDTEIIIPYKHNTGYIAVTKSQPGILHKPTNVTPAGVTRYSLYAIWTTTEKIIDEDNFVKRIQY